MKPKKVLTAQEMVEIFKEWAGELIGGEPILDSFVILQVGGEHYACKYWLWPCRCEVQEYGPDVLGAFPCDKHSEQFHAKVHWP